MPRGQNLHSMFRTSDKVYLSRPSANCRSAREAWDYHASDGPIVEMRLLDGYWGALRPDGSFDEIDNTFGADRACQSLTPS